MPWPKGIPRPQAQRDQISRSHVGKAKPELHKKHIAESLQLYFEAKKAEKLTEEFLDQMGAPKDPAVRAVFIEKIRAFQTGRPKGPMSEEQKRVLSLAHTGKVLGPHSEEWNENIRKSLLGRPNFNARKPRNASKGYADPFATTEWGDVRDLVLARDGHACRRCGKTKDQLEAEKKQANWEGLHVHHILPKADFPQRFLELRNCVTLCDLCHKQEHRTPIFLLIYLFGGNNVLDETS